MQRLKKIQRKLSKKYLIKEYGLNEKLVPIGYSSGGAHAVNFAGYYPELIKCMYIDAPLLNYNACPGRIGSNTASYYDDFAKAYNGVTRFELFSLDIHPLCRIPTLIENKIPVFLTYGPQDTTLVAEEHAMLMVDAYNKNIIDNRRLYNAVQALADNDWGLLALRNSSILARLCGISPARFAPY